MAKTEDRLLDSESLENALRQALNLWKHKPLDGNPDIRKKQIIALAEKNFEI